MNEKSTKLSHWRNFLWVPFLLISATVSDTRQMTRPTTGKILVLQDHDGDGFSPPEDCNDWIFNIHPGATEICNWWDDDCDGQTDEGCNVYYLDTDHDGWGDWTSQARDMTRPSAYAVEGGDCNDVNKEIHPGAVEICGNNVNENCNGLTDEGCPSQPPTTVNEQAGVLESEIRDFNIVAFPNPSNNQFKVRVPDYAGNGKISIRIFNSNGQITEINSNLQAGQTITIGGDYPKGTYILEAVQGNKRKVVKLIKS